MDNELISLVRVNVLINLRRFRRIKSLDLVRLEALVEPYLQPLEKDWVSLEEEG